MSFNSNSLLQIMPNEILGMIGTYLSFQDLNRLALTGKMGKFWTNSVFDLFAKKLLISGETMEERKCALAKLYREVSPNFISSLHDDIDKIKNRTFTDGMVTVEYDKNSYTPFFLINFASKMLNQVSGCEELAREYEEIVTKEDGWERISMLNYYYPPNTKHTGIIAAGSTGIKIRQTPSNSVSNTVSTKLLESLKKSSEIFFNKLYEICRIPDLDIENSLPDKEKLEKYKNKYALVIYEKDKKKLGGCHCAIAWLLQGTGLSNKVDFLNYNTVTGVYGEKEDIQKFVTILYAQQFPNTFPSMTTLRQARELQISYSTL